MYYPGKFLPKSLILLLAASLAVPAHSKPVEIPERFHGTYALTHQSDTPNVMLAEGGLGGIVLAPGGVLCAADYILTDPKSNPYNASEALWTASDAGVQLALSDITADFGEINILDHEGAFLGQLADIKISDDITCGSGGDVTMIIDEVEDVFAQAEATYPDLFPTDEFTAPLRLVDGFIYRHYAATGAYIGIKDGTVYLTGGPFGDQLQSAGTTASVLAQLHFLSGMERPALKRETFALQTHDAELTSFQVKENAAVGAAGYPVSTVFPLPEGEYQDAGDFVIKDQQGQVIPAQFEVLNRWWGKDNSLRHIVAHFNVDVSAHSPGTAQSGIARFSLHQSADQVEPQGGVEVIETAQELVMRSSELAITVNRAPFSIQTPTGKLLSRFYDEEGQGWGSFDRDDITVVVEESGPMRAVLRASSPAIISQNGEVRHGWALRLYMYADSSLLKVDFQLQNSPKNDPLGAPMYFQGHELVLEDADAATPLQHVKAGERLPDVIDSLPLGVVSSANTTAVLRDFWQRFPSGIQADENGVAVELWPRWSSQLMDAEFSKAHLYWLDDMEHSYREVLFDFGVSDEEKQNARALARTFQYPPVAVLPQQYYADTAVTLDMGGAMAVTAHQGDKRTPSYSAQSYDVSANGQYAFGQDNFGLDLDRKIDTKKAGGFAYSRAQFMASGDPADYFAAQDAAAAEINIRPQWMDGYNHEQDSGLLALSTNPYGGSSWRRFKGHGVSTLKREYLADTRQMAHPRDDQHAWFYHIEHAYLMSANLWLRDWYDFMGEFKQIYLQSQDPYPDRSHRAEGQALDVALAAYRVTGNARLGDLLQQYVGNIHAPRVKQPHGISSSTTDGRTAAFQVGYLMRGFINLYNEFPPDPELERVMQDYLEWNKNFSNFGYYTGTKSSEVNAKASKTSLTLVDPQIQFGMQFGRDDLIQHAVGYVEDGIGGNTPYGSWGAWRGDFEGRTYQYHKQFPEDQAVTSPENAPANDFLDFAATGWSGFQTGQQDLGDFTLSPDGMTLLQESQSWEQVVRDFIIAPDTRLQFDFSAETEGEIHAIMFTNGESVSRNTTIQLLGSQTFGEQAHNDYVAGSGVRRYDIPVGEYFTGGFDRIVFLTDDDANVGADSMWANVEVSSSK